MTYKRLSIGLFFFTLTSCATLETEKSVTYYVLDAKPSNVFEKQTQFNVIVAKIVLPDYLNQPNLVLRDSSQKLHVAYYHSWADNLADAVRRVMIAQLNSTDKNTRYTANCKACAKLSIVLDHFYPTTQGEVVLAGEFQFYAAAQPVLGQNFVIKKELKKDGYEHAVKKMQHSLTELSVRISRSIKTARLRRQPLQKNTLPLENENSTD